MSAVCLSHDGIRTCKTCQQSKPANAEFFHRCSRSPDGLRSMCKVCFRAWQVRNRETCVNRSRQWRLDNPERQKQAQRDWYKENKSRSLATVQAWQDANPDKVRFHVASYAHRHREARRAADRLRDNAERDGSLTFARWEEILAAHDYACAYCGEEGGVMTMGHIVPLSRGGTHTPENVVPACGPCNYSKGAKLLSEWSGRQSMETCHTARKVRRP